MVQPLKTMFSNISCPGEMIKIKEESTAYNTVPASSVEMLCGGEGLKDGDSTMSGVVFGLLGSWVIQVL